MLHQSRKTPTRVEHVACVRPKRNTPEIVGCESLEQLQGGLEGRGGGGVDRQHTSQHDMEGTHKITEQQEGAKLRCRSGKNRPITGSNALHKAAIPV